ncbi:Monoamine oxidase [Bryocella elongata]|uniref:Tryptophan 2-monooxygenase n=1 Tax=Bryocella elongata TaxID=863522 RepID=A0A1H6AHH5_9BACT|nr:NAD(P)/FAD-dependent oxidoreductase [Bryocella elongata]SEG47455.1 Monoamine oxidase [Bryocella elongata]
MQVQHEFDADLLILGAGMSGLAAARALGERGMRVLVLEARDRIGGRVWSQRALSGDVVELGAEFIHGRAPELWSLIEESGVTTAERDGVMLRETSDGLNAAEDHGEDIFAPLENLEGYEGEDLSFADWLNTSDVPEDSRAAVTAYVEGFNAADATKISIKSLGIQQKAEDETEGYRSWHVHGGYVQLADYLATRLVAQHGRIETNCVVESIAWQQGSVEVTTSKGTFRAPRCGITLPLGVLQQVNREGGIRIEPQPAAIAQSHRMEMGQAARVTLVFRSRWWEKGSAAPPEELQQMGFLLTRDRLPSVWWTARTEAEPAPTLTGWSGGPRSLIFSGRTTDELAAEACSTLAKIFQMDEFLVRSELLSAHTHDWTADPFSRGAYSYVAAGGIDAPRAMTEPEQNTLFFAGEHTDVTGHWGTVHAAIRSGLRAAEQILDTQSPRL